MSNFNFLETRQEYLMFAPAAIEAEKVYRTSPAMCAAGCRKALELAVKWVYSADKSIQMPYRDNLQSLIHEPTFRFALDSNTWGKLRYIIKLGNLAVHTEKSVRASDAVMSMRGLFEFIQWIDYCYGADYTERKFEEARIPREKVVVNTRKIKEQESLLEEKDAEIEKLRKQVEQMAERLTAQKEMHRQERTFVAEDITEWETRKKFIDVDLEELGWKFTGEDADVWEEYQVNDMTGVLGQKGYVDYVLFGKDGLPLALVEAKRTGADPNAGRRQAMLYADCLERKFGRRPMMFTSNGFETYFWDDLSSPQRSVSGMFSKGDLQKLMNRRTEKKDLLSVPVDDRITDRYYQKEAIRAVCENVMQGHRKNLLVMATGTGKTRTAASLTDVFSRAGQATNILFLADRLALVKQAKDDFKNYLPDMSLCNLCTGKDDKNARIVFSTYPTMLNAIDSVKNEEGNRFYTPTHFDLIIIDESHRSIFKKYRAIFEYFDAILVGLTATPKTDVDRNTYDFFEMEHGVPTYAYDYETAVEQDHVLVPYYTYIVKTEFLNDGITYEKLSAADRERYEEDFEEEDGAMPDFIPSEALNRFVFNELTVERVLQDLMERGVKTAGGDRIGKTIIFAQNKKHAEFILKCFNKLYPKYCGTFAQRVLCDDAYAQTVIDDFKKPQGEPHIAISVDMMDTGIDVPECVNLVFFKKVRSKTKFWQMIGRGTRLAEDLICVDQIDGEYTGKRRFIIFDYCNNFEFFGTKPRGYEGREAKSLSEMIYGKRIRLITAFQEKCFSEEAYRNWRNELVEICCKQAGELNDGLISVKLKRKYVEKYRNKEIFQCLNETDEGELLREIAPIVTMEDKDEMAKRFDNFMYGMVLAKLGKASGFQRGKKQLCEIAEELEKKANIPQIEAELKLIGEINTENFWKDTDALRLEHVRSKLRGLMKFLAEDSSRKSIMTRLQDPVLEEKEGVQLGAAYDFENYRRKVNRYVEEHRDSLAIYKLFHNKQLTEEDYRELERVLTEELGSREDYQREFGDTPFGLLVRKIAKLDHEAAMTAFSAFINDESLNQRQIQFVYKIINHMEQNGYMENIMDLQKPPFDKPVPFIKMFDAKTRASLIAAINDIREHAVPVMA